MGSFMTVDDELRSIAVEGYVYLYPLAAPGEAGTPPP